MISPLLFKRTSTKNGLSANYQFSQLTSVLNECISNTIKHASFNKINATFTSSGNKLTITYNDNGKGWEAQQAATGIGVRNMEERIGQMNGEWKINNDYPKGYRIHISCLAEIGHNLCFGSILICLNKKIQLQTTSRACLGSVSVIVTASGFKLFPGSVF